ncbi:receptor-like protein kinase HSL1 [Ipomoea triloba]|uniref:receptor-like protein kinase HSL1 n=1 Tax=Ipomoea triloba TaxID=35885 RepID=UPI00125E3E54|nr:receptor-like protein kinase HSL1 [Ipomoea triloba]
MLQHHPIHHAFFFFILLLSFPNYSQSLTTHDDGERGILLSLKQHWENPSSLERWNSTSSPCHHWPEISCIDGSVTEIYLSGMNIRGSFPSKIICQLSNLSSIYLSMNYLWGTIPVGLSNCSKLEELDLFENLLTGKIPGELFSMKTLRFLNLQENMLSGEIPTIPMVAHTLEYLLLSFNQLNGSIPDDIGNFYNLVALDLSMNSFSGPIPARLLQLQQLSYLSLSFNKLSGEIPTQLFSMKKLISLRLGHNMLSGEIPTLMVSQSLQKLDLSSNHLNGSIPATLLRLHQLSYLLLASNNLTGEIPASLDLFSLIYINLSHNHLSGSIPRGFEELQQLETIDVSHNKFSGEICETVSRMSAARLTLRICKNHFSGRIPYQLMDRKYKHRCFDEANLCSYVMDKRLPTCPSQLFSDYSVPQHCASNKPSKSKKIISAIIAVVLIVGLGILILVFRYAWGRRRENDGEEWSIISLQRLEFNKWDILGNLTDENLIGNGGSGKVYRVITKKGQSVAVKSIWHEPKQGQGLMEKQFLAEVKILGGIWHNNIVKLLCCIRGKTTKLLVYEYMDKQCAYKWLHGKKRGLTTQVLQWERRLKIAIGASQGLCYIHHS